MKNPIRTISKTLRFTFLLCTAFVCSASAQSVNFSGTWKLDPNVTDFGKVPQWAIPAKYVINEESDKVSIEKTIIDDQSKEIVTSVTMLLDGTIVAIQIPNGGKAKSSSTKDVNQNIHIAITSPEPDGEDHITEDWSLAGGGKTLIINRSMVQSDGVRYSVRAYYEKQ